MGRLIKWNTTTWDSVVFIDGNNKDNVKSIGEIDISKDGKYIALAGRGEGLFLYDIENSVIIRKWSDMPIVDTKENMKAAVSSVSFRHDGKVIAIGMKSADQTWLYDIETRQIIKKIQGEDGLYSPTKNELIVKKIKEYDGSELLDGLDYYQLDESEIPENLKISEASIESAFTYNSYGNQIIVAGRSGKIRIIDLMAKNEKNNFEFRENSTFSILAVSYSNKYLVTRTAGILFLVDIEKYTDVIDNELLKFNIYPNPSQNTIIIEYFLRTHNNIDISVTNSQGNVITNIFSGFQEKGQLSLPFSTLNLASGSYYVTIESNGHISSFPIEILR